VNLRRLLRHRWTAAAVLVTQALISTHATRGIVQTIDAHTMVIARSGDRGPLTFALTPSTRRHDPIAVGATVSVRYREEGSNHVAVAIALQQKKDLR
jgi:hypothetical protein